MERGIIQHDDRIKDQLFSYETVGQRAVVYIDESGFSVDAPRDSGYSEKGERCYASKDWHSRGRVNAIGAICEFIAIWFIVYYIRVLQTMPIRR